MFNKASIIIWVCGMLVQLLTFQERYFHTQAQFPTRVAILVWQGLMFLMYPLLGHFADVCLNRYRTIRWSFLPVLCGNTFVLLYQLVSLVLLGIIGLKITHEPYGYLSIFLGLALSAYVVGTSLYKANIIQFGLDQLLESPTTKLIAFIHWYYWAQNVGCLITYYVFIGLEISNEHITPHFIYTQRLIVFVLWAILSAIIIFKNGIIFFLFIITKKDFYIQSVGLNPFKNIYKVLKYSWKHKVPEHRSAFTYWEEDIPHRIDLGKMKYGGPFTNEEVEDTKTFFRILPLLLCLFGCHLAGDGYSAPEQLLRTSCPSLPVLLLIVINPLHISTLVVVVGIPLYRLVIKKIFPHYRGILILTRIWIGLFLCLVQTAIYINVVLNHDTKYWQHHSLPKYKPNMDSAIKVCLDNYKYYNTINTPVDNTYLWFIIPQLLNGLSSLLVSMTAFEFICAQAPRTTQGLLIGLWYATFSIRHLVVGTLDNVVTEKRSWLICEGVKEFLILVSLVLFSCVSRRYRYRQRDEIVNVQGMIEDTHERWLDQEEEYMQEREAILAKQNLDNVRYEF